MPEKIYAISKELARFNFSVTQSNPKGSGLFVRGQYVLIRTLKHDDIIEIDYCNCHLTEDSIMSIARWTSGVRFSLNVTSIKRSSLF